MARSKKGGKGGAGGAAAAVKAPRAETGEYERGCSLSVAERKLSGRETLACVVELAVQEGPHESSYAAMGPNGGAPSAHSMALVKHEGVLYVYDPQHRAAKPRKSKISPRGLRPLLGKFEKVRYLSGECGNSHTIAQLGFPDWMMLRIQPLHGKAV